VPANRFRDRLAPASANGRIGDARDEWLKEPARMADAEAVDESRQTHQCTIWNYAGFRLKINQPYHGVWEQIPKRTARTTVAVRIGDRLRWTCSCLAGIVVRGKKSFTAVAATACGKAVSLVGPPLAYVLALGGIVQYEQASRRYE
jgi:hypothetical protein